jgi:hypothetical protein
MKNLDRFFVILLIIVPLFSAIVLSLVLTQKNDVAPDDTNAHGAPSTTPLYEIQPIDLATSPTPTFDIQPINAPQPESAGRNVLDVQTSPTVTVTSTPTSTIEPTEEPEPTETTPEQDLNQLPVTGESDVSMETPSGIEFNVINAIIVVLIITLTTGTLVLLGKYFRK